MTSLDLNYSKSKIDRAGELLKKPTVGKDDIKDHLEILSAWRAYHVAPLASFASVLRARVKKIDRTGNSIVTRRLKRTPSILLKLNTHKTMRLSMMQDIGGLRAIFDTVDEVYELMDQYRFSHSQHTLFGRNDYIEKPKQDGYRGVHLVYKLAKSPSVFLEIQIRSHLQHVWATGVEVFGTLKSSSFKSGYGDEKWLTLFSLVSSVFALKESKPVLDSHKNLTQKGLLNRTKKLIRELKVIEQLNVYTGLYKIQSRKSSKGRTGHYVLILLDSNQNTIAVSTFAASHLKQATAEYLDLEQKYFDDINMNVVLVNTGDIKKLEVGYPNYFMDTKILERNLSLIAMDQFI